MSDSKLPNLYASPEDLRDLETCEQTWPTTVVSADRHNSADEQYIPASRIRELVEKWRDYCDGNYDPTMCERCDCADELAALIEEPKA